MAGWGFPSGWSSARYRYARFVVGHHEGMQVLHRSVDLYWPRAGRLMTDAKPENRAIAGAVRGGEESDFSVVQPHHSHCQWSMLTIWKQSRSCACRLGRPPAHEPHWIG